MKISSKTETQVSPMCTVTEYPIAGEKNINFAVARLSGRYPGSGFVVNEICKELVYVTEGEGKLIIEKSVVNLKSGDVVLIEPGEKYFWEGHMTLLLSCAPAWNPEQHRLVEENFVAVEV